MTFLYVTKKLTLFLVSFICLCSCTTLSEDESSLSFVDGSNSRLIKIAADYSIHDLKISEIVGDVKIVRFSLPNHIIMAGIDKFLYHENKIVIMDAMTTTVFFFDLKGNFLFRINSPGFGPGEYSNIDDISLNVSDEELLILDLRRYQVLRFSLKTGEYIGNTRFSFFTFNMSQLNKDTRVFYNAHIPNGLVDSIEVSSSSLFITNNENDIQKSLFPLKKGQEKIALITRFGLFQNYSEAGGVNYVPLYDNKIYHLHKDGVQLSYVIDSDYEFADEKALTNYKGTKEGWMNYLDQNNLAFNLTNFQETEDNATFQHTINGKTLITIYDKITEQNFTYSMTELKDDLGTGVIKPDGIVNGYFATVLSQAYFNKKNLMLNQQSSGTSDSRREYLKGFANNQMTEDKLLVLIKFKKLNRIRR